MTSLRIKHVAHINRSTLREDTDPSFRFRYIDIGAISELGRVSVPAGDVSFRHAPSRARRLAPSGAVLLSTVRTYLRAIAPVPDTPAPLVFSTGFAVLEAGSQVDDRYLAYYCQSQSFVDEVVARSAGVSYPAINASDIGNIPIALPPLGEQCRIADFLDTETAHIDRLAKVLRRTVHVLAERRAAGVLDLVSGARHEDRRPSGLGWVDTLPSAWPEVRLGLIARMGSGHTPSRSNPDWWVDRTIPWITTGEVQQIRDDRQEVVYETREMISEVGLANSAAELHPAGTVVLSRTASAGFSAVMGRDMATSQDFVTWTCGPRLDPYYLLWCLRAMRPDLLGRLATGSTHKTIYFPDLQMLRIPLPDLQEQKEIVGRIREQNARIDELANTVNRQLGLLAERRAALVTAAVMGELDVSSASGRGVTE